MVLPHQEAIYVVDGLPAAPRLLRTTDDGATWCPIATPAPVANLLVAGPDLYLVTIETSVERRAELWRLAKGDSSVSWERLPGSLPAVPQGLFRPHESSDYLIADIPAAAPAAPQVLWHSLDGGATWQARSVSGTDQSPLPEGRWLAILRDSPGEPRFTGILSASPAMVAMGLGGQRLLTSPDGGSTWTILLLGPRQRSWGESALLGPGGAGVAVDRQRTIWTRESGNSPWQEAGVAPTVAGFSLLTGAGGPAIYAEAVQFEPERAALIMRSDDRGETWSFLPGFEPWEAPVVLGPRRLLAISSNGIRATEDDTSTWRHIVRFAFGQLLASGPPGASRRLYVVNPWSISRSLDGGSTWQNQPDRRRVFHTVAPHPHQPDRLYASIGGKLEDFSALGILHRSDNGGVSWNPVHVGTAQLHNPLVGSVLVTATTPPAILAASDQGLYRSEDEGGTWTAVLTGVRRRLFGAPGDPRTIIAHDPALPSTAISNDGGRSWRELNPLGEVLDLHFHPTDSSLVFGVRRMAASWEVFRLSVAEGQTAAPLRLLPGSPGVIPTLLRLMAVTSRSRILVRDGQGLVWETPDGGETWIEPPADSLQALSLLFDASTPSRVLMSSPAGLFQRAAD